MDANPAYRVDDSDNYESVDGLATTNNPAYIYIEDNCSGAERRQTGNAISTGPEPPRKSSSHKCARVVVMTTLILLCLMATAALAMSIYTLTSAVQQLQSEHRTLSEQLQSTTARLNSLEATSSNSTVTTPSSLTTSQLSSLESSIETLTARLDAPINIFGGCFSDSAICIINSVSGDFYWRGCNTVTKALNVMEFYTLDVRCLHNSGDSNIDLTLEVAQLSRDGDDVFCACSFQNPQLFSPQPQVLDRNYTTTCSLRITRCPVHRSLIP